MTDADDANYQWIGNGVLATLTIASSDDSRGITYSMRLEFEDLAIKTRREHDNERQKLAEGDSEGRNSSAKQEIEILKAKSRIDNLEKNALKRGDGVLPR